MADAWNSLRESLSPKTFSTSVQFRQIGASLEVECWLKHHYDEIVEGADRARQLQGLIHEQTKEIFWKSSSLRSNE